MLEKFEDQKKYWDKADISLVGPASPQILADAFKKLIRKDFTKSSILDFGCGTGRIYSALNPKNYLGVDISKKYLNEFNKNFPVAHTILIDKEAEIPTTNTFDLVICFALFPHLKSEKYKDYLKELSRLVRVGGEFAVSIFTEDEARSDDANWFHTNKKSFIELAGKYNFYYFDEIKITEGGGFQTLLLFEKK